MLNLSIKLNTYSPISSVIFQDIIHSFVESLLLSSIYLIWKNYRSMKELYFVIMIYITSYLHVGTKEAELFCNGKGRSLGKHQNCTTGNKNKA